MPPGYLIIMINKICSKAGIDNKNVSGRRDYENLLQTLKRMRVCRNSLQRTQSNIE